MQDGRTAKLVVLSLPWVSEDLTTVFVFRVKNRAPAAIQVSVICSRHSHSSYLINLFQVTAEQLLRDVRLPAVTDSSHTLKHTTARPRNVRKLSLELQNNGSKISRSSMSIVGGRGRSSRSVFVERPVLYVFITVALTRYI
jgi:hypothetical protein